MLIIVMLILVETDPYQSRRRDERQRESTLLSEAVTIQERTMHDSSSSIIGQVRALFLRALYTHHGQSYTEQEHRQQFTSTLGNGKIRYLHSDVNAILTTKAFELMPNWILPPNL